MGSEDHPRSRGVYRGIDIQFPAPPGSSPLARGLREYYDVNATWRRIIPARAGFTRAPVKRHSLIAGSSPLARGLLRP